MEAVASGWKKAKEQSKGVQPERAKISEQAATSAKTGDNSNNMVFIQGGNFEMGNNEGEPNEKPVHTVAVASFYLSKFEVTVAEYMAFVEKTKSHYPEWMIEYSRYNINTGTDDSFKKLGASLQSPNNPIVGITWADAVAYCDWLSKKTGHKYRLPTEAEWEYAARGGNQGKGLNFSGSNDLDEVAWYEHNSESYTHTIGLKKSNELGLFDMSGNAWEWCNDWTAPYKSGANKDVTDLYGGHSRVIRGGAWDQYLVDCRSTNRSGAIADGHENNVGFRVAMTP